jgi:hypothetical protein
VPPLKTLTAEEVQEKHDGILYWMIRGTKSDNFSNLHYLGKKLVMRLCKSIMKNQNSPLKKKISRKNSVQS